MSPTEALEKHPGVYQLAHDEWQVVPETLGPVWSKDPTWDGPRDPNGYILPKFTLGYQAIKWGQENLLADDSTPDKPIPFKLTGEQARFVLWFYAIDETGRFAFREVVLQRLKGWGKDPLAAFIAAIEFVGPCRFDGWAAVDMPEIGVVAGEPVAKAHPRAWVQIAAVSKVQTQNTMKIFNGLFTEACKQEHSIDIGRTVIYADHGRATIEAVTSSPASLEGNRPTLVIKNETHHWHTNNSGIEMAEAIERNSTKAKGGAARTLAITNAYAPGVESAARNDREAFEAGESGLAVRTDTMYDTLEAPADARLEPKLDEGLDQEERERLIRKYLTAVVKAVRGDSWWLDLKNIVNSILNPKNKPTTSRRFWYNQITATEDAWADPRAIRAAISAIARENRLISSAEPRPLLEAGWIVHPNEPIVIFFDGSKSDDATALVGCRLSDGYVFTLGVWQPPKNKERRKIWLAPREAVDKRVDEVMQRFNVIAFWADPSHADDDEDSSRYWDGLIDKWMRRYKDPDPQGRWGGLDPKHWPTKSGHRAHAIMFDMTSPERRKLFVGGAEEFTEELHTLNDIEEFAPTFEIDGHPALVRHMENAIAVVTNDGVTLMKSNRESANKIDLAVCAVGARLLRKVVLNKGMPEPEKQPGVIWGYRK